MDLSLGESLSWNHGCVSGPKCSISPILIPVFFSVLFFLSLSLSFFVLHRDSTGRNRESGLLSSGDVEIGWVQDVELETAPASGRRQDTSCILLTKYRKRGEVCTCEHEAAPIEIYTNKSSKHGIDSPPPLPLSPATLAIRQNHVHRVSKTGSHNT